MLTAALWGLVQGLTEFLPISSSGHLVILPALFGMEEPDLATTAVLHLGTLVAVVWYFRSDLRKVSAAGHDAEGRHILKLLAIGTIPAAVLGLSLDRSIDSSFSDPRTASIALMITGVVLGLSTLIPAGKRALPDGTPRDAIVVGLAQAFALLPGISRSGMTITTGMARGLDRVQAARYGFLLAIPTIAGAGLLQGFRLIDRGEFEATVLVGMLVAAVTGYFAVSFMVRLLARMGMAPFALYCLVFGAIAYLAV